MTKTVKILGITLYKRTDSETHKRITILGISLYSYFKLNYVTKRKILGFTFHDYRPAFTLLGHNNLLLNNLQRELFALTRGLGNRMTELAWNDSPLVSVIVPIFNTANYLQKCLDSILEQTLTSLELICIDDGSTDGSREILTNYIMRDARVKVIYQMGNKGVGLARNQAMKLATGCYLAFLDSDDFYKNPDTLELLVKKMESSGTDLVVCNSEWLLPDGGWENGKSIDWNYLPARDCFEAREIHAVAFQAFIGWPWDKLYRSSFVRQYWLFFQEYVRNSNDALFVFLAVILAKRIAVVQEPLIAHRRRNCSLELERGYNLNCLGEAIVAIKTRLLELGVYATVERSFLNWVVSFILWYLAIVPDSEKRRQAIQDLREKIIIELLQHEASYFYDQQAYQDICKLLQ